MSHFLVLGDEWLDGSEQRVEVHPLHPSLALKHPVSKAPDRSRWAFGLRKWGIGRGSTATTQVLAAINIPTPTASHFDPEREPS